MPMTIAANGARYGFASSFSIGARNVAAYISPATAVDIRQSLYLGDYVV